MSVLLRNIYFHLLKLVRVPLCTAFTGPVAVEAGLSEFALSPLGDAKRADIQPAMELAKNDYT